MKIIDIALRRPTAIIMFYTAMVLLGIISLLNLPIEIVPSTDYPKLTVHAHWPGSSPETVQIFLTSPIEEAAVQVAGVREVTSSSFRGRSQVDLEFTRDTDMNFAALDLNERLSLLRDNLPAGAYQPVISQYVPQELQRGNFFTFSVTGGYPLQFLREIALKKIKPPLASMDGVADVAVLGGSEKKVRISLDRTMLDMFRIQPFLVARKIREMQTSSWAGTLPYRGQNLTFTIAHDVSDINVIKDIAIAQRGERLIKLKDIAEISLAHEPVQSIYRINGNPRVQVIIEKEPGTNTLTVAKNVKKKLQEIKGKLPADIHFMVITDQSEEISKELSVIYERVILIIGIIFIVLLALLRDLKTPLIILSSIVLSAAITINLIYFFDISINILTLTGLALGFGLLVDNSIVVLENIFRYQELGLSRQKSSLKGASEVALPIFASTLTTVGVFFPFVYFKGRLSVYYLPLALVIAFSLLASLCVSYTLIPSFAANLLHIKRTKKSKERFRFYQKSIRWIIQHKAWALFITILLFSGSFYLFNKYVSRGSFFARREEEILNVFIEMPSGAEIERIDEAVRSFEEKIKGLKEIEKLEVIIYDPKNATIRIEFPEEIRSSIFPYLLKEKLIAVASQHAGISIYIRGFGEPYYRGGFSSPYYNSQIKVLGYNYDRLKQITQDIAAKAKRSARVKSVAFSSSRYGWWSGQGSEIVLRINREALQKYDLSVSDLLYFVRKNTAGSFLRDRIKVAGKEMMLDIKIAGADDFDLKDLENLIVTSMKGEQLRIADIASIKTEKVPEIIDRENQQYQRTIFWEYRGPAKIAKKYQDALLKSLDLPPGYSATSEAEWWFLTEEEKEQIHFVIVVAIIIVFIILAALYESLLQPFIILFSVPFALIGVFLIFFLTDTPFDSSAYIGVVLLGGIVVNNSIILVDHINLRRREGKKLLEAVIIGSTERIRPILMTSITTVGALLPLLFYKSETEKTGIWSSLALSAIGGLISSTFFTLTVIPILYLLMEKIKLWSQHRKKELIESWQGFNK
jgi:HAE1 family hydrophobic/amphiphilic exporter-1